MVSESLEQQKGRNIHFPELTAMSTIIMNNNVGDNYKFYSRGWEGDETYLRNWKIVQHFPLLYT